MKGKPMQLSRTERLTLANQYLILENLYPDEVEVYQKYREALEHGYELEYDSIMSHVYDDNSVMTADECLEVMDILDMFRSLKRAYEKMEDKTGLEKEDVQFDGFDGNNETKQLMYAYYLYKQARWTELGEPYNSHAPRLNYYR